MLAVDQLNKPIQHRRDIRQLENLCRAVLQLDVPVLGYEQNLHVSSFSRTMLSIDELVRASSKHATPYKC